MAPSAPAAIVWNAPNASDRRRQIGACLLDLGFLERNMLAHDGVVLAQLQLAGLRPGILLRDIEIAGVGSRYQLDLNRVAFGHDLIPETVTKTIGVNAESTRKGCA